MVSSRPPALHRPDPGRWVARLLCLVFGLLGALPLAAGALARTKRAEAWVSEQTAHTLERFLGITASYKVELTLLPLEITLHDLRVESNDGGEPAVKARRVAITPRVFSLIAGRIDIGDIEIDQAEQRLIIRDGKVQNLSYRLPETSASKSKGGGSETPFRSLSATEARFDIDLDGTHIKTGAIDLDVYAEREHSLDVALRVGESHVTYPGNLFKQAPKPKPGEKGWPHLYYDEDALCGLDARLTIDPERVVVRRFALEAEMDVNLESGNRIECSQAERTLERDPSSTKHPTSNKAGSGRISIDTSRLVITLPSENHPYSVETTMDTLLPMELLNRLSGGAPKFAGWAELQGDLR
ncbi:MAG TPA: AsmA family protein, partial [Polyangiaceae bacterium]|nr:AsmA family protein [Polyangiaceae bacterium]